MSDLSKKPWWMLRCMWGDFVHLGAQWHMWVDAFLEIMKLKKIVEIKIYSKFSWLLKCSETSVIQKTVV
jgi:hypothetical protein